MIKDKIRSHTTACLSAIDRCEHLEENDKVLYRELINNAANGTNGLNKEEKLQNVSETVFSLVMLKILDKCTVLNNEGRYSIYKMLSDCKWAICVLFGILSLALILRPELSALITSMLS